MFTAPAPDPVDWIISYWRWRFNLWQAQGEFLQMLLFPWAPRIKKRANDPFSLPRFYGNLPTQILYRGQREEELDDPEKATIGHLN